MAAGTTTGGSEAARHRGRRPLPAIALFLVLGVVAAVVWTKVIGTSTDVDAAISCDPPNNVAGQALATASKPGQTLGHDALDRTEPVPATNVQVKVLNGSTARGQASIVGESLKELGFASAGEATNDPVYPGQDMKCRGQIRFGPNGASAARTLSLVEPCAQLVRDDRQDATVDLALGRKFDTLKAGNDARKVLDDLAVWAAQQPDQRGGQQAQAQTGAEQAVSPELLAAARSVHC